MHVLTYVTTGLAVIASLVVVAASILRVSPKSCAVITRMGKHSRVVQGGWHLRVPVVDQVFARVNGGLRTIPLKIRAGGGMHVSCDVRASLTVRSLLDDSAAKLAYDFAGIPPYTGGTRQATIETNRIAYVQEQAAVLMQQALLNLPFEEVLNKHGVLDEELLEQLSRVVAEAGFLLENACITEINTPHALYQAITESEASAIRDAALIRQTEAHAEATRIRQESERTYAKHARQESLADADATRKAALIAAEALEIQQNPARELVAALSTAGLDAERIGSIATVLFPAPKLRAPKTPQPSEPEDCVETRELQAVEG